MPKAIFSPLPKLQKKNRRVQIIEEIKRLIIERDLQPGDPLATEQELAEGMGVSRTSVREAVKALELVGILKVSPKFGCVVGDFDMQPVVDQLSFNLIARASKLKQLVEARILLEVHILPVVCQNATEANLKFLEKNCDLMEKAVKEKKGFLECDSEFHRGLFAATQNEVLESFGNLTREFFESARKKCPEWLQPSPKSSEEHRAILQAIRAKDPEKAEKLMKEHLSSIQEFEEVVKGRTLRDVL